jgi:spermidine/putrescine-binding protein
MKTQLGKLRAKLTFALGGVAFVGSVLLANGVAAQPKPFDGQEVVLYTFGGTQLETTKELVIEPFEKETGAKVIIDDTCCQRLQAAMEGGQFIGDLVIGLDRGGLMSRDSRGWLVHDDRLAKIAKDHGAPDPSSAMLILHNYSYVIAAKDASVPLPKSWAEFFDVAKFPGTRGLNRISPTVQLEAALLADGVPADKLYPLDTARALKKLTDLKSATRILVNASGADQINNLGTGETTYQVAYSNRVLLAKKDGININFTYDDGFLIGNGGAILKGAKNVDAAVALLEYHYRPDVLARFAERTGMAPAYASAADQVSPEFRPMMPTSPENLKKQHILNDAYWQQNLAEINTQWVNWLAQ